MLKFSFITDPKTGKKSVTLSVFVYGFAVTTLKLLLSGIEVTDKIKFESFSGVDYAAAIAALGSVYVMRKNKTIKDDKKDE